MSETSIGAEANELLAHLIRFNTVNPPGNERAAQEYLAEHLARAGFSCELLGAEPERPNLVARLRPGAGDGAADGPDALLPRPRRHGARRPVGVDARSRGRARSTTATCGGAARST